MNTTTQPPVERRATRAIEPVTQAQFLAALDEHACAFKAWNGHGPEVVAKRKEFVALLNEAGIP